MPTLPNSTLAKIKQALASAYLPAALSSLPPQPQSPGTNFQSLIEPFARELTALRGQVHRAASDADAIQIVLQLIKQAGASELLAWADSQLPIAGLGAAIRAAGYSILDPNLPPDSVSRKAKLAELGRAAIGLTGATAGLADTGTLALVSGPGRPRLASLLPPVHIALLSASSLLPDLPSFFAVHPNLTQLGSNLILITGPSRTSDIELTPVFGVHGPKSLHVVLM